MEAQAVEESQALLQMQGIARSFPGVRALDGVDFDLKRGEVHALMGENGAGKSTLMKVLGGVYQPDAGTMTLRGQPYRPQSPRDALASKIGFIHQELTLVGPMSVAENIMLGRFPSRGLFVDSGALLTQARQALERLQVHVPLEAQAHSLSPGMQQMVEIARALSQAAEVLILDEPTAALSEKEAQGLFEVLRRLREAGTALVYISHRMAEVHALADRITVLRDGRSVGTWRAADLSPDDVVRHMVGRELGAQFPPRRHQPGQPVLEVEGLARGQVVRDVSFTLRAGEIVGMAGLVGAGRTEIARLLVGADAKDSGVVRLHGRPVEIRTPRDAVREGLGYVTEDRKAEGLVLDLSLEENAALASLERLSRGGFLDLAARRKLAEDAVQDLAIRARDVEQAAGTLSGGNQQKVVLSRWLARGCQVLILDEPTRGVDVGARAEIYRLVSRLADEGRALLLISSDLPEVMGLSDRVLVVHQGRVAGEFPAAEADAESILHCALTGECPR